MWIWYLEGDVGDEQEGWVGIEQDVEFGVEREPNPQGAGVGVEGNHVAIPEGSKEDGHWQSPKSKLNLSTWQANSNEAEDEAYRGK